MRDDRSILSATDGDSGSLWFFVKDLLATVLTVGLIGVYLFAISGVWPPLVAVESGSMEPHLQRNDLVFVMEEHRFAGRTAADSTGVVPQAVGRRVNYTSFGGYGDVIVYQPNGHSDQTPIIHRAMLWVEPGENWVVRARDAYLGSANTCAEVEYCPAEHAGFITKGDANSNYDQVGNRLSRPVRPGWIVGTAEIRIPWLGWLRLQA